TTLAFGAFLFAIQIYCDFSGYSDIALGSARLFGIELLRNFNYPYFSRDIAEFWRRWHISLSTWFKDYLYIPLGGSRGGDWMRIRNTFIIFLVSGFWHGANWTFIFWGFLNALFIMPSIVMKTNRNNLDIVAQGKILPSLKEFFQVVLTFSLATFCWIFFRAESISDAFSFIKKMFTTMHIGIGYPLKLIGGDLSLLFFIAIMFVFEWLMRDRLFPLRFEDKVKRPFRWMIYIFLTLLIIWFHGKEAEFIYFQF
ncbi:MAG: MBOAT family protein, partial [Riemerella sp.]|nr:MBOAT family protein [Riemerella sp.]